MINIKGLRKDLVLLYLYNHASYGGKMFNYPGGPKQSFESNPPPDGQLEIIQAELRRRRYRGMRLKFEFIDAGGMFRGIQADITDDSFDPSGYDHVNGIGEAKRIIDLLRESLKPDNTMDRVIDSIRQYHEEAQSYRPG